MTRTALGLAGLAAALVAGPALAHHAFAIFDQSKVVYLSGTVKEFELVNPHAWLHLTIAGDKGESTWSFEGGSVSQLVSLRLGEREVQARRASADRLPSDEGWLPRRPDHERQAARRREALLQPRLRRRHGPDPRPVLSRSRSNQYRSWVGKGAPSRRAHGDIAHGGHAPLCPPYELSHPYKLPLS